MLILLSWSMIIVFMILIMKKKLTPFSALVLVPLVFTTIGAFLGLYAKQVTQLKGISNPRIIDQILVIGDWVLEGIKSTSTTAVMLLFAILYFSIMLNAGLFDPLTKIMIQFAKGDPAKVVFATAIVAAIVSLNGNGTTTTLIVCTAFIPIYKKLGIKMMNLGVITILMFTIMNLVPWAGPTARVISVLGINEQEILIALIPGMVVSVVYMLGVSIHLGLKERKRIGIQTLTNLDMDELVTTTNPDQLVLKRPENIWINAIMTISLLVMLMFGTFPTVFLFIAGTALGLVINYKSLNDQRNLIQNNAGDAVQVTILIFAAGIFMGLFTGSGMANALAFSLTSIIPAGFSRFWGLIVAFISVPGTFFLSNDAFYYGILPILVETGAQYGFTTMEIGTASLLGQAFHLISPLVAFIYLLLNLTGLDMGEWQKESAKWTTGVFIIFIAMAVITGALPLYK